MTWRFGGCIGALALCFWAWSPNAAQADHRGREQAAKHYEPDRHHEYSRRKHRHARKHDHGSRARGYRGYGHAYHGRRHGRHGIRNFVYDDGYCRTTYKYRKHGFKYAVRCRDRKFRGRRSKRYERHGAAYVIQPRYVAQTLESAADGQSIVWNEPRKQARYEIVPTQSYQARNGRYCREFLSTATVGGQIRQVYGKACRQEDGSWELVR